MNIQKQNRRLLPIIRPFVLRYRRVNVCKQINTAGGRPAASHFFLLRQRKSNQKEGDPGLPPLRGSLRCSTGQAAAELALRAQTVLAEIP
jgi:hypothetical protein